MIKELGYEDEKLEFMIIRVYETEARTYIGEPSKLRTGMVIKDTRIRSKLKNVDERTWIRGWEEVRVYEEKKKKKQKSEEIKLKIVR